MSRMELVTAETRLQQCGSLAAAVSPPVKWDGDFRLDSAGTGGALCRLRQKDCCEFVASLVYKVSSGPTEEIWSKYISTHMGTLFCEL